jgi:hypothetical protein
LEWIAPLAALIGVFIGARLTSRSAEVTRLRDLRLSRYERLLGVVDKESLALQNLVKADLSPSAFGSLAEWTSERVSAAEKVDAATDELVELRGEMSLFLSESALDELTGIVDQSNIVVTSSTELSVKARETLSSGSVPDEWPHRAFEEIVSAHRAAQEKAAENLQDLRSRLVVQLRRDLGIDPPSGSRLRGWLNI